MHIKYLFLLFILTSLNSFGSDLGTSGLIDVPSARMMYDGDLKFSFSSQKIANSANITYQAFPWLETTFRYTIFNPDNPNRNSIYPDGLNDRSYAVKLKLLDEGRYSPQLALGISDLLGTGTWGSEYIVASKKISNFDINIGLGWGRLAERYTFKNPMSQISKRFDSRFGNDEVVGGNNGGKLRSSSFFSGEKVGVFGGVSYKFDRLNTELIVEYNSDSYARERRLGTIKDSSPISFGMKWYQSENLIFSLNYQQKNQVGLSIASKLGTKRNISWKRPNFSKSLFDVDKSDSRANELNINSWYDRILYDLENSGIILRKAELDLESNIASLEISNGNYILTADAVNRVLSLAEYHLPAKVRNLNIILNESGARVLTLSYSRMRGSTLLNNKISPNINILKSRNIENPTNITVFRKGHTNLTANIATRFQFFDPDKPLKSQLFLKIDSNTYIGKGWTLIGSYAIDIWNNFNLNRLSNSVLPHVRSDVNEYLVYGKSGIHSLYFEKKGNLSDEIYYRSFAGILEDMYSGIGVEVLYMPFRSRLAYGFSLNSLQKRGFERNFKLMDYKTSTGFISIYYALPYYNYDIAVHIGRYLAKDVGSTIEIRRTFDNGFSIGAFASFTDVSSSDFGEGSFDKGLFFKIPFNIFTGQNSKRTFATRLRSVQRDGGQRLNDFSGRLWSDLRSVRYDAIEKNKERMILK